MTMEYSTPIIVEMNSVIFFKETIKPYILDLELRMKDFVLL